MGRAILCKAYGPPETLVVEDVADPSPGPGEVAVRVRAVALNFFDTLIIQGKYQIKPPFPFSPGAEFAGEIVAVGDGVSGFAVGDRVAGMTGYGACRERLVAPQTSLVAIPDGLDDVRAAGLFVTYGTSMHALRQRGELKPGETLVVLGAAGGTGLSAVEIGKLMGARVIACASSDEKLDLAVAHGADETVNYAAEDLGPRLKQLTKGKGVDVLYDPVGDRLAEPALRAMGWGGRYLVIGFAGGEIPKIPLNLVLLKGCDVRGVFWGAFTEREPAEHRGNVGQLLSWAATGQLRAHVGGVYEPDGIVDALNALARREAKGKLVIRF
ncbi:MAG: NADPH:quinone oxidoreductase [Rhizobiales bacterium 65-9]|nr:NADPH:quinone oxidoreductase family protein [Hyphomicrobiales bacterium]OJY32879.1 MAG: NADPH:quinone oxidoreductase [Rhizobiales bacterium 65-9]